MPLEKSYLNEDERKKNEISEKEIKEWLKKQVEFKKTKEKINVEIETEDEVFHLKELVEKWLITHDTAKKIIDGEDLWDEIIQEIFDKIDEIEDLKDVDKYIPQELRISKDEYLKAVHDDIFRVQILTRLDSSLTLIANQINPDGMLWLNIFSWFLAVLDKNLIKVQENTIDVKDSLKEIDNKKGLFKDKRTFLQKIIDFIKEIFR